MTGSERKTYCETIRRLRERAYDLGAPRDKIYKLERAAIDEARETYTEERYAADGPYWHVQMRLGALLQGLEERRKTA